MGLGKGIENESVNSYKILALHMSDAIARMDQTECELYTQNWVNFARVLPEIDDQVVYK